MNDHEDRPTDPEAGPPAADDAASTPHAAVPAPDAAAPATDAAAPAIDAAAPANDADAPQVSGIGQPAPLDARLLAAVIDWVIVIVVGQIPNVGGLASAAYLLIRDGLETDFMDHRSIGKRIMKLRPVRTDGVPMDATDSIRRNWMFAVAGVVLFLAPTPVGWVFAIPLGILLFFFMLIEAFLVVTDPQRRRFGDRIADTIVIQVDS